MSKKKQLVYQFRVFVRGISPVIWRRLLFLETQTLADLHHVLQSVFGWSDVYLHQFFIRGRTYAVPRAFGANYTQPANEMTFDALRLRDKERFLYEYNFFHWWQVEIRLEKKISVQPKRIYPMCIGGKRAGPLEDCGGADAYLELKQSQYSPISLMYRLQEIIEETPDIQTFREQVYLEFPDIAYWLKVEEFNLKLANQQLRQLELTREESV
jgi:Plasmid pRiA4b ORF-3-like protein